MYRTRYPGTRYAFLFFIFSSSGGWVKIKLELPHKFHVCIRYIVGRVRAVCARLGGKVAVEGLTDVLPMKGKIAKNYPQVW